jgi:hypothetical protein
MKKFLSSIIASAICLSASLPAFAGSASLGGGSSNSPVTSGARIVFLFTTPSENNNIYSITLSQQATLTLFNNLPNYRSGEFGSRIQLVASLLFPNQINSSGETVINVRINNLGNAIANFNASLTPAFIRSLSAEQLSQLRALASILQELRRRVDN